MFKEYLTSLCVQSTIVGAASVAIALYCLFMKHYSNVIVVLLSGFINFSILNCLCMSKCSTMAWLLVVVNLMHLAIYSGLLRLDDDVMMMRQ